MDHSALRRRAATALAEIGERLTTDAALQRRVDSWVTDAAVFLVDRYRHDIASIITDTVERFDTATQTWAPPAPPMPTARDGLVVVAVGRRLFAIGGSGGTYDESFAIVEIYDSSTDAWTSGRPMPTPPRRPQGRV